MWVAEKPRGNILHVAPTTTELFKWLSDNNVVGAISRKMGGYELENYRLKTELGIVPLD